MFYFSNLEELSIVGNYKGSSKEIGLLPNLKTLKITENRKDNLDFSSKSIETLDLGLSSIAINKLPNAENLKH